MSETQLTTAAADALSGAAISEWDGTHPTIGESTYYTTWFKLMHKLVLLAQMPGNSCRAYQDGDLTCGVRAGYVQVGGQSFDYAGCATQSLTNNATNYIFLTATDLAATNSVTINTTGFPTDGTLYLPLATIVTSGGTYDDGDITDYRGRALLKPPGALGFVVEENTAGSGSPNVLIAAQSGKILSNEGSTATNYHTLPTAVAGLTYTFIRADATDDIRITAAALDKIVVGTDVSIAAGYAESTARWDTLTLVAIDEEYWVAVAYNGTWTVQTS